MRIRNLNPKPTTFTGNPLMRTRWQTIYRNGDCCFTVNSGNNGSHGLDADFIRATTSFDIIANYDLVIPGADVAPWITGLPDGQVCFLCDVEPLQDINVMMQAYGQTDKNKNFNVSSGIVKASVVPGSRIVVSAACRHQLDNRNCTSSASPGTRQRTDLPREGVVRVRIRNLYDPPTLKDRDPVVPWVPGGMTASARLTAEGCEITVTGDSVSWLYPPLQDGLAKVVWEKADGGTLIGIRSNDTVAIYPGVTVLVRLCGYEDASLVTMLNNLGLPLVFAASDHPY